MIEHRVSFRYARALLETANKEGVAEQIFQDFQTVNSVLQQSRELLNVTISPIIQYWKKKKIYKELFENMVSPLTMAFIILLTDKRRETLIPSILNEYKLQYYKQNNKLPIEVTSVVELNEEIRQSIIKKIADWTKKTILPEFKVDSSIKGGILVKIDDWVYDATLRNQLNLLYKQLVEG